MAMKSRKNKLSRAGKNSRARSPSRSRITSKSNLLSISKSSLPDRNNPTAVKEFLLKESMYKQTESKGFFRKLFASEGIYKYAWATVSILLFTLLLDFICQLLVHTNFAPYVVYYSKKSLAYLVFTLFLIFSNLLAYAYLGYKGVVNNFRFDKTFSAVFNITILFVALNIILILVGYFTFLQPYLAFLFAGSAVKFSYLLYLIVWTIIKGVIFMFVASFSYLVFQVFRVLLY